MKKLLNPENLFLLVIFCLPSYLVKTTFLGVPTNLLELLALLSISLFIIKKRKVFLNAFVEIPAIVFFSTILVLFGLFLSTFFNNNNLVISLGIIKGWFIIPMLFSFILYLSLTTILDVEKVFKSIYFSTVIIGFISISYKLLGVTTYDNRLSGIYLSPNYLSMYLAPGIFFGIFFLIKEFLRKKYSALFFANTFFMGILILSIYYTYSYGTWAAIVTTLLIISPLLIKSRNKLFAVVLFLFITTISLLFSQRNNTKFLDLVYQSSQSSFSSRQMIWRSTIFLISEKPLIGIGPGNFQKSYLYLQKYYPPYLEWAVPQPHNIFLAFWLQSGLIGLIGFLLILLYIFKILFYLIKNKKNTALAEPLLSFFIYIVLHGLIDTTYWKNDLAFSFWISVFAAVYLYKKRLETEKNTIN
jgi:O-antigen ligase